MASHPTFDELPTPDDFFLNSQAQGHKNILREVMRVLFDITLISPHPNQEWKNIYTVLCLLGLRVSFFVTKSFRGEGGPPVLQYASFF